MDNYRKVYFWCDIWVTTNMPLYHLTLAQILEDMAKGCVANIVTPEGSSHWNLFSYLLFHHVLLTIVVIKPLDVNCGNDHFYWAHSNSGIFTAKSVYQQLSSRKFTKENSCWRHL